MSKLAELDFIFRGNSEAHNAFIVMHGYGADMNDLAPIGQWLSQSVDAAFYFLQAPNQVALGPYMSGRAWFPIDMMKLQMATNQGDFAALFERDLPPGIDESAAKVVAALEQLKSRHQKIHLAGFSQGSMLAAKVALENQPSISSLSMLSGVLVSKSLWQEKAGDSINFPTFQSHGTQDPVLPVSEGRKLKEFLNSINANHKYVEFSGGHEIPMPVLTEWLGFIKENCL
ncbi:MAG: hypothetical protein CME71_10435 [Halobacteriovorax sp.]|nr:hypothetical protein [Halobacteriovorax sp.]